MAKRIGFSSLMDSRNLSKSDFHFEVLGNLDECSAALALARSFGDDAGVNEILKTIQMDLSTLMGVVAGVAVHEAFFSERLAWVEGLIGELKHAVTTPSSFIIPGETRAEASLDFARAVARRAERSLVRFLEMTPGFDATALQYLNRISTVLYLYEIKARNPASSGIA